MAGSKRSSNILIRAKKRSYPEPVMIKAEREGTSVEVAMTWNDSYHESMLCFTNNIPQARWRPHLAGSARR